MRRCAKRELEVFSSSAELSMLRWTLYFQQGDRAFDGRLPSLCYDFPCHYCEGQIVSGGVDEVQFIEPYPKSLAIDLHDDSIVVEASGGNLSTRMGLAVASSCFQLHRTRS